METLIPVICDTPACGTVWFSKSLIGIGQGATISLRDNTSGPCPNCKGTGHIPDGEYTNSSATLFNSDECNLVLNALEVLHQKVLLGTPPEEIKSEITKQFPFLSGFAKFIPRNPAELAAYLAILVTLFTHFSTTKPDEPAPPVQIELNISQALEQVSSSLKNSQPSTLEQQPTQEKSQIEEK